MAERPRIGVTGNDRRWSPSWWCTRIALRLAGACPVRISLRHHVDTGSLDALIIGGGDDISAEHYGGEIKAKVKNDPERDNLEISHIKMALQRNLPLLGICRGAQLINVVLGGNLHQDIRPLRKITRNRPGLLPTKRVNLEIGSQLARICGKPDLKVNSLHHQAIKDTGEGLEVVGRDLDGIIQAVECSSGRRIIGVQWHPEYLLYLPSQFAIFREFLHRIK